MDMISYFIFLITLLKKIWKTTKQGTDNQNSTVFSLTLFPRLNPGLISLSDSVIQTSHLQPYPLMTIFNLIVIPNSSVVNLDSSIFSLSLVLSLSSLDSMIHYFIYSFLIICSTTLLLCPVPAPLP